MTARISVVAAFMILFAVAVPAQDLTLDEILKKNEDALGGADVIAKVQTLRMTSRLVWADGQMETLMVLSAKRPNLARAEISSMGNATVSGYDGTTGWMIMPGSSQAQKLGEPAIAKLAGSRIENSIGSLARIKAGGNKVELLGKENVNGAPAYKLSVVLDGGVTMTYFLDAGSFLPVRIVTRTFTNGQELESESYPGNYKRVGGILFAHSMEMRASGLTMQGAFDLIEVNVPLDDSLFKMPVSGSSAIKK